MAGKLIKAGVIYTICSVVLRGISFFTVPLFIRLLTTEEFGRYNVFLSIEGVLFVFSALAVHASIKNALYDKKERFDEYVKNCIYIDFFNSLLIALIANLLCLFFSDFIDLRFTEVNLLVLSGFCQAAITIYTSKLIMGYKAGDYVIISFLSIIVGLVLSLLFIFTIFDFNHYFGRIWGAVLGQAVAAAFVLYKIFGDGFSKVSFDDWRYGLKISLPIVPHGVSQIVLGTANTVMIKYIFNAALAGIYSFTYTVTLIPQVLFSSVSNVWEPWFFETMNKEDYDAIKHASTDFCKIISAVFVAMACIVPEMIKVLATPDYYDAMDISVIVLMGCYFSTLYYIPCEIEYFYKKTDYIAISTVACALLTITLNLVLMQYFSYKVAAYVTLFSYASYFSFHMLMSRIICHRWMFDVKLMLSVIVLSIGLMSASVFLKNHLEVRLMMIGVVIIYAAYFIRKKKQYISNYGNKL